MKTLLKTCKTIAVLLIFLVAGCKSAGNTTSVTETPTATTIPVTVTPAALDVNYDKPCIGASAPAQWNHVVVLMFENHQSSIGSPSMPNITDLAHKCGTSETWNDADVRVDGTPDGDYHSKPSYATLTSGLSPSAHGLLDDVYETKTEAESIFDQLNQAGKSFKVYYDGEAGGCSILFPGAYHDPIRYYTSMASICDEHDVPLDIFMTDVNNGDLPDFSMIIPSNDHNMHNNTLEDGDAWAKNFLEPFLNSEAYQKGDVALFFLWDEDSPVPNVLISPSIAPDSKVPVPSDNPISHFSALRTWEEMLGLPLLGDASQAPSLLTFFEGAK